MRRRLDMHVEKRTGSIPGIVFATVRHGASVRNLTVELQRTASGRYNAHLPNRTWSVECQSPESAILMHAALVFPVEVEDAPWLRNIKPARLITEPEEAAFSSHATPSERDACLTPLSA